MSNPAPGESPVLSFRHLLSDAVSSFLQEAGLGATQVVEPLSELIVTLSRYREEGEPLFPVAFMGDDLGEMLRVLDGKDEVAIGTGPRTRETIQRALKQCAPLGQGRWWSLYVLLVPEGFAYGIFRTDPFPLVETPLERMRRAGERSLRMVGVLQLAENVIELRGMRRAVPARLPVRREGGGDAAHGGHGRAVAGADGGREGAGARADAGLLPARALRGDAGLARHAGGGAAPGQRGLDRCSWTG